MSRFHILSGVLVLGVAVLFAPDLAPGLQASTPQEVTVFNFKVPVQVPGRVLPAGRYLFKLEQSGGELNVVEIKNPQESKVYGVFLVKPDYRGKAPSQPRANFRPARSRISPGNPNLVLPGRQIREPVPVRQIAAGPAMKIQEGRGCRWPPFRRLSSDDASHLSNLRAGHRACHFYSLSWKQVSRGQCATECHAGHSC